MASTNFLSSAQEQKIIEAIRRAENQTSGEIRIHIENEVSVDPLERAAYIFHELGMDQTDQQNGVLIYIASDDHKAAIYGGQGIHQQIEDGFWGTILNDLMVHFKHEQYVQGLEETVRRVGKQLTNLFPPDTNDVNELTDEISYKENRQSN